MMRNTPTSTGSPVSPGRARMLAVPLALVVGLLAGCSSVDADSDAPDTETPASVTDKKSKQKTTDAEPKPSAGGPAPTDVVARIAGDYPTPEDFRLCSAKVAVMGATEASWESEAIAGNDVMGYATLYSALSEDGTQRVEAQATESYDDSGLIYAFAVVDSENNVTYSSSADEATFTQSALNLKGISAQGLDLSSNEADGTSVTADVAFTC